MIRSAIPSITLVILAGLPLAAAEATRIPNNRSTDDLRVLVGMAPGITSGRITKVRHAATPLPFDQDLEGDGVGIRGGLRYLRGWWSTPSWGWKYGIEGMAMSSRGSAQDAEAAGTDVPDTPLALTAVGGGVVLGPTGRFEIDSLELPMDLAEVELLVSGGPVRASVDNDGATSSSGLGWQGSATAGVVFSTWSRWQFSMEGGYAIVKVSDISWSNTGPATLTAAGPTASFGIGRRW